MFSSSEFGAVGDTNIFYWFQNRRSKSRSRQRKIQAVAAEQLQAPPPCCSGCQYYGNTVFPGSFSAAPLLPNYHFNPCPLCFVHSCSSSAPRPYGAREIHDGNTTAGDHLFGFEQCDQSSNFCYGEAPDFHHQSGYCPKQVRVLNGVAIEVRRGVPVDKGTMLNVDNFVSIDAHGFLVASFQHGWK